MDCGRVCRCVRAVGATVGSIENAAATNPNAAADPLIRRCAPRAHLSPSKADLTFVDRGHAVASVLRSCARPTRGWSPHVLGSSGSCVPCQRAAVDVNVVVGRQPSRYGSKTRSSARSSAALIWQRSHMSSRRSKHGCSRQAHAPRSTLGSWSRTPSARPPQRFRCGRNDASLGFLLERGALQRRRETALAGTGVLETGTAHPTHRYRGRDDTPFHHRAGEPAAHRRITARPRAGRAERQRPYNCAYARRKYRKRKKRVLRRSWLAPKLMRARRTRASHSPPSAHRTVERTRSRTSVKPWDN